MSSAVVALVPQPEETTGTTPPTQTDQFSAFGVTVVHRRRKMTEEGALAAMAEISAVIFRPRSTIFSIRIQFVSNNFYYFGV